MTERDIRPSAAQAANAVVMVRPAAFGPNRQTAASNRFASRRAPSAALAAAARREFDVLAATLERCGIDVLRFEGQGGLALPDEVFPNNWISFHEDGTVVVYPLLAPNRRAERRADILAALAARGFRVGPVIDLTQHERSGSYLEGTGSLVLDRIERVAYACRSPRTSVEVLAELADGLGYETQVFDAVDRGGRAIYHTNVMLSIGTGFALLGADAVRNRAERRLLRRRLAAAGRDVVELTQAQLGAFAANALELAAPDGPIVVLSAKAFESLRPAQRRRLAAQGRLVTPAVDDIETYGGGSVRCMLAEVHLPRR